jgi:hypothetical protein
MNLNKDLSIYIIFFSQLSFSFNDLGKGPIYIYNI